MVFFTKLAIFWLAFAGFVVPLFVIALICSIIKAVRTRHEMKQRIKERESSQNFTLDPSTAQKDSEIITVPTVRKKPNLILVEDEDRRKQFRTTSGHLVIPERPNIKKLKPRPKDTNVSNISDDLDSDCTTFSNSKTGKRRKRMAIGRNGHVKNKSHDDSGDDSDVNNGQDEYADYEITAEKDRMLNGKHRHTPSRYPLDTPIIHNNNDPAKIVKNETHSNKANDKNMRNCKSLDEIHKSNTILDIHDSDNELLLNLQQISLKLSQTDSKGNDSVSNGHARAKTNDVGDGVAHNAMEMNSLADCGRSKSEDNLIEQLENPTDNYLTVENAMVGSENRAYAKSTETTAM